MLCMQEHRCICRTMCDHVSKEKVLFVKGNRKEFVLLLLSEWGGSFLRLFRVKGKALLLKVQWESVLFLFSFLLLFAEPSFL